MTDMLSLLSEEEKTMIEAYINAYAVPEGCSTACTNVGYVLREWARAKRQWLGKLFNDQLIYSEPITYSTPEAEISDILAHDEDVSYFRGAFQGWIDSHRSDWSYHIRYCLTHLVSISALSTNKYDFENAEVPDPSRPGKFIRLANGSKTMKMIGKIYDLYAPHIKADYEKFRIAVSQALNKASVSGNLCISIHPLDYMTMSDNACDWDSCMSWKYEGSYRQGTVEMMNSPVVVVAYLTSKQDMMLTNNKYDGYWNNKKWRSLYICAPQFIGNVKGYPYQVPEIDKIVISKLRDWAMTAYGTNYSAVTDYHYDNDCSFNDNCFEFTTGYMYNDFGTLKTNYGCYDLDIDLGIDRDININYSGASECMLCGSLYIEVENEELLACEDCYQLERCDECGSYDVSLYETGDGNWVCEDCLMNYYNKNLYDDKYYRMDDMTKILVLPDMFKDKLDQVDINGSYDIPYFYDNYDYSLADDVSREHFNKTYLKEGCEVTVTKPAVLWGRSKNIIFYSDLKEEWTKKFNDYLGNNYTYGFENCIATYSNFNFKDTDLRDEFELTYKKHELTF